MGNRCLIIDAGPIIIGDDCNISTGITIWGPMRISNNVMITAGTVIINDVPDNVAVAVCPYQNWEKI